MAKPRKVVRTKRIYKKTHSKLPGRVARGVLFVLLLVLLVGFGYMMSKAIGGWLSQKPEQSSETTQSSVPSESTPEESLPESSEEPEQTAVRGVVMTPDKASLTGTALTDYLNELKAQGYTTVFVTLKDENGDVWYQSDAAEAIRLNTVRADAFDAQALCAEIKKAGLTPAAHITGLRDPKAAHVRNENSFAYANQLTTNWLDSSVELGGKAWLNPYMEKARLYLSQLAADAAAKGFEQIAVSDVNFPTRNTRNMNTILTEPSRTAILGQTLDEMQAAAGDVPVYNWVDMAEQSALSENAGLVDLREIGYEKNAPEVSLDAIAQRRGVLSQKFGTEADDLTIAKEMLRQMKADGTLSGELMPVILKKDVQTLLPVLEELEIESYLVV